MTETSGPPSQPPHDNADKRENSPAPKLGANDLQPPTASDTSELKKPQQAAPANHSRSKALWWFSFFLLITGLAWFSYWYFYLRFHPSTDDAYSNGNFISINSVISGAVIAYYADETDLVEKGKLLVELDRTNYQSIYEKELAALGAVTLKVRGLYDDVKVNQAIVENKRTEMQKLKFDYHNRLKLKEGNPEAVAYEDYVHSEHDHLAALYALQQAEFQLESVMAAAGNTPPDKHPLIVEQRKNVRIAYYQLMHCAIYAPQTGYVAQRTVETGQWVTPTTNLMAVIPATGVWVDANYKETELGEMRIGQPAEVWFDFYGSDVKYTGEVIGIASGTGSLFSLIPPQNATGNWIKIVQRLPVRISLDPEVVKEYPVRLGISAEVHVDITNQNLPRLALNSPKQVVSETDVFDIHMEKVDQLMDKIIQANLKAAFIISPGIRPAAASPERSSSSDMALAMPSLFRPLRFDTVLPPSAKSCDEMMKTAYLKQQAK